MRGKRDNNNNGNSKRDNGSSGSSNNGGSTHSQIEYETQQELKSIIDQANKDVAKDWERISGHAKLKKKYETMMETLPNLINTFTQLEEKWNVTCFLEDPQKFIDLFNVMTYRVDSNICLTYKVEDLKTIHHLNMYMMGHIIHITPSIATTIAYLEIIQPNYDENNHLKHLIRVLMQSLTRFLSRLTYFYKSISHHDIRVVAPHKLKKYPLLDDLKALSDTYIYGNCYTSIVSVRNIKHSLHGLYNFLILNKDNWKEVHDSL